MDSKDLEWRMYGLVPYNLSPIQQGIQFGHAVQEFNNYAFKHLQSSLYPTVEEMNLANAFHKWRTVDKTFIILNGGTTNDVKLNDGVPHGTLNQSIDELMFNKVTYVTFRERDLQNAVTAVVFLVDERVWNKKKYPPRNINPQPPSDGISSAAVYMQPETEEAYTKRLGGEQNVWLRQFLSKFELA